MKADETPTRKKDCDIPCLTKISMTQDDSEGADKCRHAIQVSARIKGEPCNPHNDKRKEMKKKTKELCDLST